VIDVHTHALAAGLADPEPGSRLAAMFSIPYVVAVALREGQITPAQHGPDRLQDPDIRALALGCECTTTTPSPRVFRRSEWPGCA